MWVGIAPSFTCVQAKVSQLLQGAIVVGHALDNDFAVLHLQHPEEDIRDTALYKPLCHPNGRPQKLKHLASQHLRIHIQRGEHTPVDDARAALYIYFKFAQKWERAVVAKRKRQHP